jgi:hypothetical protein
MTTIGGPGGIGGPNGPSGPDGSPEIDAPNESSEVDEVSGHAAVDHVAHAAQAPPLVGVGDVSDIDALATEVAAGRLTPQEAIDRLVESTAGPELGASERAELRELLSDLVANDPYLGSLIGRI